MANVRIDTEDGTAIDKNLGEDVEDAVMDFTWRRHQQSKGPQGQVPWPARAVRNNLFSNSWYSLRPHSRRNRFHPLAELVPLGILYGEGTEKAAILKSQARAAQTITHEQLALYYGIGRYVSQNSRNGFWGKGTIDNISKMLREELPGLKGFSPRNIRNMRMFYEQWNLLDGNLADRTAKTEISTPKANLADTFAKLEEEIAIVEGQTWRS